MISDLAQLKRLIKWAQTNKVKKLKIDNVEFELSELSFVDSIEVPLDQLMSNMSEYNTETLTDTLKDQKTEDDQDLFWSSNS